MKLAISEIDATILVVYMLAVVLFGLYLGRGQRTVSDYLLGGRRFPWWAVLLSIVATETSTVTFLSVPGIAWADGTGDFRFLQLTFGYIVGRLMIVYLFLPHYFRGELFTAYEVLDKRFGGATKQTASMLFLITRNLADGLRLFLTAIVMEKVVGVDLPICIAAIGVATIIYTVVGGMKSVVWNDCIQFVVYMLGAVVALGAIVTALPGGWSELTKFAAEHDKFRLFDFSSDLTSSQVTFWVGLIGGMFLTLATHGTDQMMVQRYLGARSQKDAGWALALSGVVVCAQFALFLLIGVGLACFYHAFSPAVPFANKDEVFASFIVHQLPVGVVGITLAAVFSAAMSTLSSSLNSSAAAAVNDFYLPTLAAPAPGRLLRASRLMTVVFGLLQVGVGMGAYWLALDQSVVYSVLSIAAFASGLILGVFFLSVLTTRVTQRAALVGLVGGCAILSAVAFGTEINGLWYTVVGSSATVAVGLAAAWLERVVRG
jgi:SSS family solute:Na+ symporter